MQHYNISPASLWASIWRNRSLIAKMTQREVIGRYRGSLLGILWSFLNPLFMLAVFTFVFTVVFQVRWQGGGGSRLEFAMLLFVGLIVFNIFSECVNRAPGLVISNANYVKKVVFPLETLVIITLGSAIFHALVSLGVWLVAYVVIFGAPFSTALLLPVVLMPLFLVVLGLTWMLASLGVFLRDVSQIVVILTTTLMFLSPIFYPLEAVPEDFRWVLELNPLAHVIEQSRDVLFWGNLPNLSAFLLQLCVSALVAWGGYAWFQTTRRGFADVL